MSQNIEGLPDGVKIVSVKLDTAAGNVHQHGINGVVRLEPDNVYGILNLAALKIPEGFTRGPFDVPSEDEWWLSTWGAAYQGMLTEADDRRRIILIPHKPKRVLVLECEVGPPLCSENLAAEFTRLLWHGCELKVLSHRIEERKP